MFFPAYCFSKKSFFKNKNPKYSWKQSAVPFSFMTTDPGLYTATPTVEALIQLWDNYDPDEDERENLTDQQVVFDFILWEMEQHLKKTKSAVGRGGDLHRPVPGHPRLGRHLGVHQLKR